MAFRNFIIKRSLRTERPKIGQVFIQDNVQKFLKDITRFNESKLFAKRPVSQLKSPMLMFMTDEQLDRAKDSAYEQVKARIQMPPVMDPDDSQPEVLARDEEIVGYTQFKIMFVDITPGYSNRNRLMSVREKDGTLRYPTHGERSRLNTMFYPDGNRGIDIPALFDKENLSKLLKRKEYVYVLNRACVQFEPDDPKYCEITSQIYNHIDDQRDFELLRSTRHFGPMSLYLAYNKNADNLIVEMLSKNYVEDAVKLVKIYNTCHNIQYELQHSQEADEEENPIDIIKQYAEHQSAKKYNLDLAIQAIERKEDGQTKASQEQNHQLDDELGKNR